MNPEVLIVAGASREALRGCLERAGIPCRLTQPGEAVRAACVGSRIVCDRMPGWEALVASVGPQCAVVLYGQAPSGAERRRAASAPMEVAASLEDVAPALGRAEARLAGRRGTQASQRLETIALINELAQAIAGQGDLPRVISEAIARTRELCEADGASLLLVDAKTGELHFEAVSGDASGKVTEVRLGPGQGIAGAVASSGVSLWVPDVRAHPSFDARCDQATGFQTGSAVAVPLHVGGDLVGVLEAVRHRAASPLGADALERLELLAPHVAIAIHNGQITAALRRAQTEVLEANLLLEKKVAERTRQISQGKKEWESTFDAISEPMALQDGFVIRRANRAYARQAGAPIQTVPGKTCHQLLAHRPTPCPGCPLADTAESAALGGEIHLPGAQVFRASGFWVDEAQKDTFVVHYRDVTHERTLEERLRESERLAAVGQLASGAAHEINNPLGFVASNLQSLRASLQELSGISQGLQSARVAELMEDCTEMISESLDGARRVADIVRGLRELSRLEISGLAVTKVSDSVSRAVRAELANNPRVTVEVPEGLLVRADPLQLDQVLVHLLRNARQAIAPAGHVSIRATQVGGEVLLRVEDDGSGIAPEHLRRVFEPFFSTRGVGQGVGLGLTAAWGIVSRFGGRIEVQSEPKRGAAFTVRLPAAVAQVSALEQPLGEA